MCAPIFVLLSNLTTTTLTVFYMLRVTSHGWEISINGATKKYSTKVRIPVNSTPGSATMLYTYRLYIFLLGKLGWIGIRVNSTRTRNPGLKYPDPDTPNKVIRIRIVLYPRKIADC